MKLEKCPVARGVRIGFKSYANDTIIRPNTVIGRYCSIGRRCHIGATNHQIDWLTTHPIAFDHERPLEPLPTTIGNDVWIGDNVLVMPGVTIGDGAIVGGGAVVTKDVAPYTIVAGVPARPLRPRFDRELAERLLAIRWWDYQPDILDGLSMSEVEATVTELEKRTAVTPRLEPHHTMI